MKRRGGRTIICTKGDIKGTATELKEKIREGMYAKGYRKIKDRRFTESYMITPDGTGIRKIPVVYEKKKTLNGGFKIAVYNRPIKEDTYGGVRLTMKESGKSIRVRIEDLV